MLAFIWDKKWLWVALLIGYGLIAMPTPEGLSPEGQRVLAMSVVATVIFVTEPIPLPTVALLIAVAEVFLLGVSSKEVSRSFMSDSVFFIMGSLMLAVALVKQGLDKRIALAIIKVTGTKLVWISTGISLVSALLASFIGEHTVAAMMLPVALSLISLSGEDPKKIRNVAAILLFSISYGCSIAGIGTPSGGARNAIMIGYWADFFGHDNPLYNISYLDWMAYAYPMIFLQLPFLTVLLFMTFKPEMRDLSTSVGRLKEEVAKEGPLRGKHYLAIALFAIVLVGWITLSERYGMGTIAILGAAVYLIFGLVRWEDYNSGVNWGVVLLYAAAISLGLQMMSTGGAAWVAQAFLGALAPFGFDHGMGLWLAVILLTTLVTNTMSNGAAGAILGPIVLNMAVGAGESPLVIGYLTAIASAFAYLTVVGTPACTIVYSSGYLKTTDFLKMGWKMVIMSTVVMMLFAKLYWPLLGV